MTVISLAGAKQMEANLCCHEKQLRRAEIESEELLA